MFMGIITAANVKFPLCLVAKGLTRCCGKQFGDVADQSDIYVTDPGVAGSFNEFSVDIVPLLGNKYVMDFCVPWWTSIQCT
jgi:hypothetical protein